MMADLPSFRARHARQHATATLSAAVKPTIFCMSSGQLQVEAALFNCLKWVVNVCWCHPRRRVAGSAASAGTCLIVPMAAWFRCLRVRHCSRRCCRRGLLALAHAAWAQ